MASRAEFKDLIAGRLAWPWGMRNEGIVATQTAKTFCRKTPTLDFLHHLQWLILGSRPESPCARVPSSCSLNCLSIPYICRALRTMCPIFLARGHLSCPSAGSEAVTLFTNTKLLPSAEPAWNVLQTVLPLPLVLLASFGGGVLVAARSPNRSLAASASAVAMAQMTRDFLAPSSAPRSLPKLCPSMRMNAGPWI